MREDLGVLPAIIPQPVLLIATYNDDKTINVMTVAWGGHCADNKLALNLGRDRKTLVNIMARGGFTAHITDENHVAEADFFGSVSGYSIPDKFDRTELHAVKSEYVEAPIITELPLVMECEFEEVRDFSGEKRVVGIILNVNADEKILDFDGKVDPTKLKPVIFEQFTNSYYSMGRRLGEAWKIGNDFVRKQ